MRVDENGVEHEDNVVGEVVNEVEVEVEAEAGEAVPVGRNPRIAFEYRPAYLAAALATEGSETLPIVVTNSLPK